MLRPAAFAFSVVAVLSAADVASAQGFAPYPYGRQPIVRPVVVAPIGRTVGTPGYSYQPSYPTYSNFPSSGTYPTYPTYSPPIGQPHHHHGVAHVNRRDLERQLEQRIRAHFGHCVRDVDVEVDLRRCEVEVDLELRHHVAGVNACVQEMIQCMPQLAGFRVRLDVDCD